MVARYYFNLVLDENRAILDREGVEILDDDLQREIIRIVEELRAEEPGLFEFGPGWSLEVVDDQGHKIATFPL
jgi:hypothetical protein